MIQAFVRGLDPKGTAMNEIVNIIPIYNLEELVKRVGVYGLGTVEGAKSISY